MSSTAGAAPVARCANHPNVETGVSCSNCGKPICPDCMVHAAVGIKCRECARMPRSAKVTLRPQRAARAVAVAFGLGTAVGVLLAFGGVFAFGFLSLIVAYFVGLGMGRITLRASGYYRAPTTGWIAVAGAAWAHLCPVVVVAVVTGGAARIGVQVLALAIAGFFAYREAT